jgi:hypothetical protein
MYTSMIKNKYILSLLIALISFNCQSEDLICEKIAEMANTDILKNSIIYKRSPNLEEEKSWEDLRSCEAFSRKVNGIYDLNVGDQKISLWNVTLYSGMRVSYNQILKSGEFCNVGSAPIPPRMTPFGGIVSTVEGWEQEIAVIDSRIFILVLGMRGGEIFSLDSALEYKDGTAITTCGFEKVSDRFSSISLSSSPHSNNPLCTAVLSNEYKELKWDSSGYSLDINDSKSIKAVQTYIIEWDIDKDGKKDVITLFPKSCCFADQYTSYKAYIDTSGPNKIELERILNSYFNDFTGEPFSLGIGPLGIASIEHNSNIAKITLLEDKSNYCEIPTIPIFKAIYPAKTKSLGSAGIWP